MNRRNIAIAAATATFTAAIGLSATSGWLISEAALMPPILYLQVAIVMVRAFGISRGVFRWLDRVVSHDAALHETVARRAALWSALAELGPRGAWRLRRGDAVTRIMQDAETAQDRLLRVEIPAIAAGITAVGVLALQASLNVMAALVFLVALVIAGGIVPLLTHRIERDTARVALEVRAEMNAAVTEFAGHVDELRLLGLVAPAVDEIAAADRRRIAIEVRGAWWTGVTQFFALAASGVAVAAGVLAGIPAMEAGSLQGPHLAVVVLLPWAAAEIIAAFTLAATALVRVRAAEQRIDAVTSRQVQVPALVATAVPGLTVADLTVRWEQAAAVTDIAFTVAPGERVALVGPSGAGKSTVLSAVLGLVEYDGTIAVGGADPQAPRAATITALLQTTHVFRTSLRENLRLAEPTADDATLAQALAAVGLGHLDDLDLDLSHRSLSGGEQQRLGLARALLVDAPYLVLDEPTEHLDDETATAVLETILAASAGRGLLMTTHRIEELHDFDRILVIEAGRLTFAGTFEACREQSPWFARTLTWRMDKTALD